MRIGFVSAYGMKLGGVEYYLDRVLDELHALGHEVAFFCEVSKGAGHPIRLPSGAPRFAADELGADEAVRAFFAWKPEIVYAHGLRDSPLEERIVGRVPTVYFAHTYLDTCISGSKTHSFPVVRPCTRVFGPACLAEYFPRRCGGLNPLSMVRLYKERVSRLAVLPRYDAILTNSEHMRAEYIKHGVAADRIRTIPLTSTLTSKRDPGAASARSACFRAVLASRDDATATPAPLRILFVSRMQRLKGAGVLIDSLQHVAKEFRAPVHAVLAGEGPEREEWTAKARRLCAENPSLTIDLPGWLSPEAVDARIEESHLLAFPSLWPEPYGVSGVEALQHGLPVVGFAVGGVPEWLHDGVNGCLAPGNPPTAEGLTQAFLRATHDAETFASLCDGAVRSVEHMVPPLHARELLRCFESVLGSAP